MVNQKKLNLACGQIRIDDFFGIDIVKTEAADAVMDLTQFPWDIESDSAEEIICSHYIEHIIEDTLLAHTKKALEQAKGFTEFKKIMLEYDERIPNDGFIAFMNEVYRILKPNGKIKIIAPYYTSMRCWQDPTHRRAIGDSSFLYFNKGWREANKLDHYQATSDFDYTYGYDLDPEWVSKHEEARAYAIKHYWNVVNDIHVVMTKRPI